MDHDSIIIFAGVCIFGSLLDGALATYFWWKRKRVTQAALRAKGRWVQEGEGL